LDRAKWQAARDSDMCLSLHQTISPKSTSGQLLLFLAAKNCC
jgi:hypothetical protein